MEIMNSKINDKVKVISRDLVFRFGAIIYISKVNDAGRPTCVRGIDHKSMINENEPAAQLDFTWSDRYYIIVCNECEKEDCLTMRINDV